jgi:FkbM family methyltransferase
MLPPVTIRRRQAVYGRLFRAAVAAIRSLRPHHWPVVGRMIGSVAERFMSSVHPAVVHVEGHEFHLDANDDLGLARGRPYEPLLRQVMERHIAVGATVIDGGAHIGYHTLLAARLVGPSGRVIAFEPAPSTYRLLAENVARNGYQNVTLVGGALTDRSGHGALHLHGDWSGDHRIAEGPGRQTIPVDLHSLDDFVEQEESVDFIKLDVQGAEPLVLRGAARLLERNPQLVAAIEYDPSKLPDWISPEAFLSDVFGRFATVIDVNDESRSVAPVTPAELLISYTEQNERHTNLLCMNRRDTPRTHPAEPAAARRA